MVKLDKDLKLSTTVFVGTTEQGIHILHEMDAYYLSWEDYFKYADKQKVKMGVPYKTVKLKKPLKIKLKKLDEK